jgi:hypothetical protein
MSIESNVQTAEKKIGVFLTAHHIVLYLLLASASITGVYLVESKLAAIADAKASAAQQALVVEKDHSAQLAAAYAQAETQREKDNAAFIQTISQVQSQTKIQIVRDKTAPAPEVGHRIETITGFKQGTIILDASDDLIVPLPLGKEIAARLDQGEADAQTVVLQAGVIKNQTATISDQTGIIAQDKKTLQAQIDADGKELNKVKADCRKSKWKWLGTGVGVGVGIMLKLGGKF